MTKFLIVFSLLSLSALGFSSWQVSRLENKVEKQSETIGAQAHTLAQQRQTIADIEKDKSALRVQAKLVDNVLTANRVETHKLRNVRHKLKIKLGDLQRENTEIKASLNNILDRSIVCLFKQASDKNDYCYENRICNAASGVADRNACPLYTTRSLVNYAIDLEMALDSCNHDKHSIRKFIHGFEEKVIHEKD